MHGILTVTCVIISCFVWHTNSNNELIVKLTYFHQTIETGRNVVLSFTSLQSKLVSLSILILAATKSIFHIVTLTLVIGRQVLCVS